MVADILTKKLAKNKYELLSEIVRLEYNATSMGVLENSVRLHQQHCPIWVVNAGPNPYKLRHKGRS